MKGRVSVADNLRIRERFIGGINLKSDAAIRMRLGISDAHAADVTHHLEIIPLFDFV